jgi:hypothetical protein
LPVNEGKEVNENSLKTKFSRGKVDFAPTYYLYEGGIYHFNNVETASGPKLLRAKSARKLYMITEPLSFT